jgi:hypothetical protein
MKTNILFLSASPNNTSQTRLDVESRAIEEALFSTGKGHEFDLRQHWATRVTDLQGCFLRYEPNIVHFSGHGSKNGAIVLENSQGSIHYVPPNALSELFSLFSAQIRCVILNACYSDIQAKAISIHINTVIGIPNELEDEQAVAFSRSFYQALGFGKDVQTAFQLGKNQISLEHLGNFQPQIYISDQGSKLVPVISAFDFDQEDLQLRKVFKIAMNTLAILEEQAAGYTSLSIPPPLRIQLDDKRREVEEIKNKLKPSGRSG